MKKIFILPFVALLWSCGGRPAAIVEGTATGLADGTKIQLVDADQRAIGIATISGGAFRFEVKKARPDLAYLIYEGYPSATAFRFILEPGTITAAVDFTGTPTATFSGTESNDQINLLNRERTAHAARLRELESRLIEQETLGQAETPRFDSLLTVYREAMTAYEESEQQFLRENPHTVLAAYLQYAAGHSLRTPQEVDSVLNLIAGAPANAFTDRLKDRRDVLAVTTIGQPAPDFTQNQPDGTPLSLSSLKGKLVLIDFWASWCGPCRAENPNVVRIYDRFKADGFEILGVSLDENGTDWLGAIAEDGLAWKHVSDLKGWSNAVAEQYAVRSIPHTVLVGPDGTILAKNLRGEALEQKIAEVLGAK